MKRLAWKFLPADLSVTHSTGEKWEPRKWRDVKGPLDLCHVGLHASVKARDALGYHDNARLVLARVEYGGEVVGGDDKIAATKMRVMWTAEPKAQKKAILRLVYGWTDRAIGNAVKALRDAKYEKEADALAKAPKVKDEKTAVAARDAAWAARAAAGAASAAAASATARA